MDAFSEAMHAIGHDDLVKLQECLTAIPSIIDAYDAEGLEGHTLLHEAVFHDSIPIASFLLQSGADINAVNRYGETPLHLAVTNSSPKMVEMLLQRGADPNHVNRDKEPPLLHASLFRRGLGGPAMIDLLLRHGASVDLNCAVRLDRFEDVRHRLESDLHAIETAPIPELLLLDATNNQSLPLLFLLLSHGADPNTAYRGRYPIVEACNNSPLSHQIVTLLLQHGANPNVSDPIGEKALQKAIFYINQPLVDLLVSHGAMT